MDPRATIHNARLTLFGRRVEVIVAGAAVAMSLTLILFGMETLSVGTSYYGSVAGGLVAGALIGTNWQDGLTAGFRVSMLVLAIVSILFAVGSFAVWFLQTGEYFFYWSSFFAVLLFIAFVPIHIAAGSLAGIVGVFVRRTVVPSHYNPR